MTSDIFQPSECKHTSALRSFKRKTDSVAQNKEVKKRKQRLTNDLSKVSLFKQRLEVGKARSHIQLSWAARPQLGQTFCNLSEARVASAGKPVTH